jgi:aspartate kinase
MERQLITGIAHDKNEARMILTGLPDAPGVAASVFTPLAEAGVNYDLIVRSVPRAGQPTDLTFTVPRASLALAADLLEKRKAEIGFDELLTDSAVTKLSIVGVGLRTNPEIAARMFATLADRKIDILAITTSEIKVSVLIPEDYTELAVRVLHTAYGLDDLGEGE